MEKYELIIKNHIGYEVFDMNNCVDTLKHKLIYLLDEVGSSTQLIIRNVLTGEIIYQVKKSPIL